jgi:hypothetical protein
MAGARDRSPDAMDSSRSYLSARNGRQRLKRL